MKTTFTIITVVLFASIILACSKKDTPTPTMIDLLTSKEWVYDTLLVNPPVKFSALDDEQKDAYFRTNDSYKGSSFKFEKNGKLSYREGGSNPVTSTWKFINSNKDIEIVVDPLTTSKDTFLLFTAQKDRFSYVQFTNGDYYATYTYK
ncbi:MAG TPA: hypothetical protein PK772_04525 [Chitinophagaceae bacterium]|nr:hypothetical protein [Chitinophagaceae bacterium]